MAAKVEEPHYLPTNTAWPIYSICCEAFSVERIPLLLLCCENSVCIICFENRQASELAELDATDIWYKCPCSNCPLSKNTGYKRSGKCYVKNRALMEILNIDAATSSTAVNPNNNTVRPNNISANPNVVSPTASGRVDEEEDNIGIDIIDLTQHDNDSRDSDQPHTSTGTLRRSQRTRRPAQRNLTEDAAADEDNDDDVETQTSNQETNTSLRRSKRQSQPTDGERSRRINRRIDSNDEWYERDTLSLQQVPTANDPPSISAVSANHLWKEAISAEGLNVWRIRCYMTESKTNEDKYARKMSQWCVNNGITITCLELAKILPRDQRYNADALMNRVLSLSHQELRRLCSENEHFFRQEGPYIRSYKQFVEMKRGDIVALHTKGGMSGGRGPPQTMSFGVIQDDSLAVMSREEAMQKQCPWDLNPRIGFMVKKVKWLRQGELKAVRGPNQVNWLAEFSPLWLMQVGRAVYAQYSLY